MLLYILSSRKVLVLPCFFQHVLKQALCLGSQEFRGHLQEPELGIQILCVQKLDQFAPQVSLQTITMNLLNIPVHRQAAEDCRQILPGYHWQTILQPFPFPTPSERVLEFLNQLHGMLLINFLTASIGRGEQNVRFLLWMENQ